MATISKEMAEEIIANNGYYSDDPRVVRVVKYQNDFNGADAYAIQYAHEDPRRYLDAPACHNAEVIWEAK